MAVEMAGAGEPAYETALSAALTQTDRPTGLRYHSSLFHSCLILPLFYKQRNTISRYNSPECGIRTMQNDCMQELQAYLLFNVNSFILSPTTVFEIELLKYSNLKN